MASLPHGLGLSARVSDFSDALFRELGLKLDRKEGYYDDEDDHWSRLVDKLGLGADKKRARLRENKTEWILRRWSHEKPDESTGRRLVEILNDLGRRDASLVVQCHLGEEYRPERKEMDDLFEAIDNAARFNDVQRLGELINDANGEEIEREFSTKPWSPLHSAAGYGHLPAVKFLTEKRFSVHRKNYLNETPLAVAEQANHQHVVEYLKEAERSNPVEQSTTTRQRGFSIARGRLDQLVVDGNLTGMRELLESDGSDPNESGQRYWAPIHSAAARGNFDAVKLLVEYGAKIDQVNFRSFIPEDWARFHGKHQVADYLKAVRLSQRKSQTPKTKSDSDSAMPAHPDIYSEDDRVTSGTIVNKTITVRRLSRNVDPEEFLIEDEDLDHIREGISKQLKIEVASLWDASLTPRKVISTLKDLTETKDIIAVTHDESLEAERSLSLSSELSQKSLLRRLPAEPYVRVHLYCKYWSRNAEIVEFDDGEDMELVVKRAKNLFHVPIISLLTVDKLSRIVSTSVLKRHDRVIAKCDGDELASVRKRLGKFEFCSKASAKFGRDGGKLIDAASGAMVHVPKGAIDDGEEVEIQIKECVPTIRMDVGDDNLVPIGDPILIETNPPGFVFHKMVTFRIPHCGPTSRKAPKGEINVLTASHDEDDRRTTTSFHRLSVTEFDVYDRYIGMEASHFSFFWAFIYNVMTWGECVASVYSPPPSVVNDSKEFQIQLLIHPNLPKYYRAARKQVLNDYVCRHTQCYLLGYERATDVTVAMSASNNWNIDPCQQSIPFRSVWQRALLPCEEVIVPADVRFLVKWTGNGFPTSPVQVTLNISGESRVELKLLVTPVGGEVHELIPEQIVASIAMKLDRAGNEDWRSLAAILDYSFAQVDEFGQKASPTDALLRHYAQQNDVIDHLKQALEVMHRNDVLELLNNAALPE